MADRSPPLPKTGSEMVANVLAQLGRLPILAVLAVLSPCAGCRMSQPTDVLDVLTAEELTRAVTPSNHRAWKPAMAVMPYAELWGNQLAVHNIRNCEYLDADDYIVRHYDKAFDLSRLQSVDFVVVPFKDAPSLAHTMLSFGFGDQDYLAVSVEARMEEGETYSPIKGALRQYELMYVVADERDVIPLRTRHRDVDVYLYRSRATPEQARLLLLDVMARVNKLSVQPEFYDTFSNNCTTNIVAHINRIKPGRVPVDIGVLLPGYADRLAYDLGLLEAEVSFQYTKRRAHINRMANRYADDPDFSRKIRQR
jgi:hypothetical protein